jgi:energy-coupling factor transporter ATP-binding protein EcfA2
VSIAATTTLGPRVVIVGNSGSGKSTLAKLLATRDGGEVMDLDRVHWQDQVGLKRDEREAKAIVSAFAAKPGWIIEGVFGWLAEVALQSATTLIWLDLPWSACPENLALRGPWRGATADQHAAFLAWAEAYWNAPRQAPFAAISLSSRTLEAPSCVSHPDRRSTTLSEIVKAFGVLIYNTLVKQYFI